MNDTFYYLQNEVLKYPTKNFEIIEALFRNNNQYIAYPSGYDSVLFELQFPGVVPLNMYTKTGTFSKKMSIDMPKQIFQAACEWYHLTGRIIALTPSIFFDTQKDHFVLIPNKILEVCQVTLEEAKNLYRTELTNWYAKNKMLLDPISLQYNKDNCERLFSNQKGMLVCLLDVDAEEIAALIQLAVDQNLSLTTTLTILDLYLRCVVCRSDLSGVPNCQRLLNMLKNLLTAQDITSEDTQILDVIGYDMLYSQAQRESFENLKIFYVDKLSLLLLSDYFMMDAEKSQIPTKIAFRDFLRETFN